MSRFWQLACVVASSLPLACEQSGGDAPVDAGNAAQRSDDAGSPDSGSDAGLACADPAAVRAPDMSLALGPAFAIGSLQGIGVAVRDDEGTSGVDGTASLIRSRLGGDGPPTTPAQLSTPPGKLCLSGNTVIVPLMSFPEYWGAGIELYLNTEPRTGLPLDAGADAGGPSIEGYTTFAWDPAPGNVIGFSFVLEANGPELACGGLPPLLRVQTSAVGSAGEQSDIHCKNFSALTDGQRLDMLFSEVTRECWDPGGRAIFAEPLPAGYRKQIYGLLFLVPADEVRAYSFDLCVSEIRPIVAP